MYAFFNGKVDSIYKDKIIIDVNNIGYEINMPESDILSLNLGDNIKIYTYLNVREDDMRLFGFKTSESLEFFKKIITVSGVGPRVALGIISNVDVESLGVAIATENVAALKSVPGIGPKMAQKIIFELKDKVLKDKTEKISVTLKQNNSKNIEEAITALEVLGYNQRQIKEVISRLDLSDDSVENIIRKVLKEMQNL